MTASLQTKVKMVFKEQKSEFKQRNVCAVAICLCSERNPDIPANENPGIQGKKGTGKEKICAPQIPGKIDLEQRRFVRTKCVEKRRGVGRKKGCNRPRKEKRRSSQIPGKIDLEKRTFVRPKSPAKLSVRWLSVVTSNFAFCYC